MKLIRYAILGISFLVITATSQAQDADPILGKYIPPEKDSVIEIFKCGDKICGRTFCIKDNAYPADSKHGTPGTPYLDHNNPDPKLKTRPNLGMQFLSGFKAESGGKYADGKVYNPRDGKTYCAKMELQGNKLELRGHLCISSWLGKTNVWNRMSGLNLNDKAWDCMK
ncbi:DUF2147 domain-containing protein [Leptospira sp. GIMC2001]|uniref:DUF2147 domain-containing protein n=1 Tax=Leptospira sp. GIMC2001 TaxID=1513297 RepID=UPI00234AC1BF|nr:DUF2147 domain-containing protein [Leptospira sp. GIMC2001]WCL48985.1 DUF2147 domain-containing protein [Leptospira sp. GIMC2001]